MLPITGHWTDPNDPTRTHDCIPGAACLEKVTEDEVRDRRARGHASPPQAPVAYVGDGCYECQDEHYRHAGHCHHCGGYQERRWRLSMLVILYMILVGCLIEVAGSKAVGSLGIFITFVQITALKYLSISWPRASTRGSPPRRCPTSIWNSGASSASTRKLDILRQVPHGGVPASRHGSRCCACSILLRVLRRVLMEYVPRPKGRNSNPDPRDATVASPARGSGR